MRWANAAFTKAVLSSINTNIVFIYRPIQLYSPNIMVAHKQKIKKKHKQHGRIIAAQTSALTKSVFKVIAKYTYGPSESQRYIIGYLHVCVDNGGVTEFFTLILSTKFQNADKLYRI